MQVAHIRARVSAQRGGRPSFNENFAGLRLFEKTENAQEQILSRAGLTDENIKALGIDR
jgi:hypothetical protein